MIIAEKPSLARNIVGGIGGNFSKKTGYFISDEYIVTWAIGHLFSLADIEHYSPNKDGSVRWTMENLPCFPFWPVYFPATAALFSTKAKTCLHSAGSGQS